MEKTDIIELESEDCELIGERIREDKENKNGFIKLVKDITGKNCIEENKFVLFNVVSKKKNNLELTGERTSIGYMLSDNIIYDFISHKIFEVYRLFEKYNKEKCGEYALLNNVIFKNSLKKIRLTYNNLYKIELLLKKYIYEYRKNEAQIKEYAITLEDHEHIPEKYKEKSKILVDNNILN